MADEILETRPAEHVTIIKDDTRRGGGGSGIIVAIIALVVIAAVAYWAINARTTPANSSDANVAAAADKVGSAAQKIGNAAEDAVKKIN